MRRALVMMAVTVGAQVGLPVAPVDAQNASATITRINPTRGVAGLLVAVDGTGCITPAGQPTNTAELFVRGPGASTTRADPSSGSGFAPFPFGVGLPNGAFLGLVEIPRNALTGSTYKVSAQCIGQGQPQGPESAGVVFTVTGPAPPPQFDTGTGTPNRSPAGTGTGVTGGASPGGATTGASPVLAQPRFTG